MRNSSYATTKELREKLVSRMHEICEYEGRKLSEQPLAMKYFPDVPSTCSAILG
ncbi:MAG: hypothetical protein ACLSGB_01055 [Dorea sp.]